MLICIDFHTLTVAIVYIKMKERLIEEADLSLIDSPVCHVLQLSPPQRRPRGRHFTPVHIQGTVLGGLVLVVKVGKYAVQNLPEPVKLTFQHNKEVKRLNQLLQCYICSMYQSPVFLYFEYVSGGEWDVCVLAGVTS